MRVWYKVFVRELDPMPVKRKELENEKVQVQVQDSLGFVMGNAVSGQWGQQ